MLAGRALSALQKDTTELIEWLAQTASRCCDITPITVSLKSSKDQQQATIGAPIEVRSAELTKLANAIASAQPAVSISSATLDLLSEVIDGRQQCANPCASHSIQHKSVFAEDDKTHQHFIVVLRQIQQILEAAQTTLVDDVKVESIQPK